jgi:hypothetical protein
MSRFRAWGLAAVATVGAGVPAVAADPPPRQTTLYDKMFGPAKPKQPGPTARSGPVSGALPSAADGAMTPDVLAAAVQAEQEAWTRRMDVCLKIRQVGIETNDDALVRQADELERQATALYNARTAALGVPRVKAPLPEPAAAALDRQLGTGAAVNPLTAPPAPTPVTGTAALKAPSPPTPAGDIREVRP